MAIKEHFNTFHCSQGISLFGTLKLKFPQSQFRFSTNSFNSLIIRLIINIWKLWIFNIQEMDFYSSTFSYFTHYSWFFFSASQTSHNTVPIKTNLPTDRAPTKHRDYFRGLHGIFFLNICVNWGLLWVHLGFTLLGSTLNTNVWKRAVFPQPLSACNSYSCSVCFHDLILVGYYSLCPLWVTLGLLGFNS